ncbi:MAG: zinc-ribbon domain-containing protein [Paracoccaceae bacterium]
MRITCPSCAAQYDVEENDISSSGQEVQCSDCQTVWMQERDGSVRTTPTENPAQPDVAPKPDDPVVIDFPDTPPESAAQEPDTFQPQSLADLEAEIASENTVDQGTSETVVDTQSPPQDDAFQPRSLAELEAEIAGEADKGEIPESQDDDQPEENPSDEAFQPKSLAELETEIATENAEPDAPDQDEAVQEIPAGEPAPEEPIIEDIQADDLSSPEEPLEEPENTDEGSEFSTPPISGFDPADVPKEDMSEDHDDHGVEDEDAAQNDGAEIPDEITEDHADEPVAQNAPEADHPDETSEPALKIVDEPAQEDPETEVFRPKSLAEIQAEITADIPEETTAEPESLTELETEIVAQAPSETDVDVESDPEPKDEPPEVVPSTPASDVVDETPDTQPSVAVDAEPDLEQSEPEPDSEDDSLDLSEFFTEAETAATTAALTAATTVAATTTTPEPEAAQITPSKDTEDEFDDSALLATFREQIKAEDKIDGIEPGVSGIDLVPEELIGRRARVPNIDELKQSVRARKIKPNSEELKRIKAKRGFKIGFIFSLSLIALIVFAYLGSNIIAAYIPSIAPYLEEFTGVMDIMRDRFSAAGRFIWSFFAQFL